MSQTVSIVASTTICGQSISGSAIRSGTASVGTNIELPAADSGTITSGVIAITGTPTVTTGTVDVFWTIGEVYYRRYGCTATLSGNNLTVTGGVGNTLPTGGQAVTVQNWTSIANVMFDGEQLKSLAIHCTKRCCVQFLNVSAETLLAVSLLANEPFAWVTDYWGVIDGSPPIPIDGAVTSIKMVNAEVTTATLSIGVLVA